MLGVMREDEEEGSWGVGLETGWEGGWADSRACGLAVVESEDGDGDGDESEGVGVWVGGSNDSGEEVLGVGGVLVDGALLELHSQPIVGTLYDCRLLWTVGSSLEGFGLCARGYFRICRIQQLTQAHLLNLTPVRLFYYMA